MRLDGTRSSANWSTRPGNWDKLNCRALYDGDPRWNIPILPPATLVPTELVPWNSRRGMERARYPAAVHFFLDDYRFETVWSRPEQSMNKIAGVGAALSPDFSLWRDMPLAMQLWQVYRSRWCGKWLTEHGIDVVPTVTWSTPESWKFCFLGIESGSVVAVSTVGVLRDKYARVLFTAGYEEMCRQLAPSTVLVYGKPLPDLDGNLVVYPTRWR